MEAHDIPQCGEDCFVVEYQTRNPIAKTQKYSDTETYPMPTEGDGTYGAGFHPGMRQAFAEQVRRDMDRYQPYGKGCPEGCVCQKEEGAKPRYSTWWTVPVEAPYTFPDGSRTISILGEFEIRQSKTPGMCRPKVAEAALRAGLPGPMAAALAKANGLPPEQVSRPR